MIGIIVARAANNIIGNHGEIPWNLPGDMRYFKEITVNNIVIMGRNTYNSIGRPLPKRINIVVSTTMKQSEGIIVVSSLKDAIDRAKQNYPDKDIYLIGGHSIYQEGIQFADKLLITEIKKDFDGDTTFANFDVNNYTEHVVEDHSDEKLPYCFMEYRRKGGK